jgi:hypothetical protein
MEISIIIVRPTPLQAVNLHCLGRISLLRITININTVKLCDRQGMAWNIGNQACSPCGSRSSEQELCRRRRPAAKPSKRQIRYFRPGGACVNDLKYEGRGSAEPESGFCQRLMARRPMRLPETSSSGIRADISYDIKRLLYQFSCTLRQAKIMSDS